MGIDHADRRGASRGNLPNRLAPCRGWKSSGSVTVSGRAIWRSGLTFSARCSEPAEASSPNDFETDTIIELETNLDDLSPELTGAALERLLALGALDVTLTPVQMKKNRPGSATLPCFASRRWSRRFSTDASDRDERVWGATEREAPLQTGAPLAKKCRPRFGEITIKLGLLEGEVVQVDAGV